MITINKPSSLQTKQAFLPFLNKNKLSVFIVAASLFGIMLGYVLWAYVPRYTSSASVLIKDSALKAQYLTTEQYDTTSSTTSSSVLNTMGLLYTKSISDALYQFLKNHYPEELTRLKLHNQDEWREFFATGESFIKAKNQAGTDLIKLKFTWWKNPKLTQAGMAVILSEFREASLQVNRAEQTDRYNSLSRQYDRVRRDLEQVRKQISQYQQNTHMISLDQESSALTNARAELQRSLSQAIAEAAGKNSQMQQYGKAVGMSSAHALEAAAIGSNPVLRKLYDQYYQLSQDYSKVQVAYTDESPKAAELLSQMQNVNRDIQKELSRTQGKTTLPVGKVFSDDAHMRTVSDMVLAQTESAMLNSRANSLRSELGKLNQRLDRFPGIKEKLSSLQQKEGALSMSLNTLESKLLDSQMKEDQAISNVFVVDPPAMPYKENAPNPKHLLILSALLGSLLGVGVVYLKWISTKKRAAIHLNQAQYDSVAMDDAWRHDTSNEPGIVKKNSDLTSKIKKSD